MGSSFRPFLLAFDLDNTLTQKELSYYYAVWRSLLEQAVGRTISDDEFLEMRRHFGKTWIHTDLKLLEHCGVDLQKIPNFRAELEKRFLAYYRDGTVRLRRGARELLDFAHAGNHRVGLCTNATDPYAEQALSILGVAQDFQAVVGVDSALTGFSLAYESNPEYAATVNSAIARGACTIDDIYAKPGPFPWLMLFRALRGSLPKTQCRYVCLEDRVANAVGALLCEPTALAFVIRHYDNRTETIPSELEGRIKWVDDLLEVRDELQRISNT